MGLASVRSNSAQAMLPAWPCPERRAEPQPWLREIGEWECLKPRRLRVGRDRSSIAAGIGSSLPSQRVVHQRVVAPAPEGARATSDPKNARTPPLDRRFGPLSSLGKNAEIHCAARLRARSRQHGISGKGGGCAVMTNRVCSGTATAGPSPEAVHTQRRVSRCGARQAEPVAPLPRRPGLVAGLFRGAVPRW